MKRSIKTIILTLILSTLSFSQDLRKQAETNPLDCLYYLLSEKENTSGAERLAHALFETGKYDDAIRTIKLEDSYTQFPFISAKTHELIKIDKTSIANKYVNYALVALEEEDWDFDKNTSTLIASLIKLNRLDDAQTILQKQKIKDDNAGKLGVLYAIAENSLIDLNKSETRTILAQIRELSVSRGEFEILTGLALIYARANEKNEALVILKELEENVLTEKVEFTGHNLRRRILPKILEAHLRLGNEQKAFELWDKFGNKEVFYEYRMFIDALFAKGYNSKIYELLAQMRSDRKNLKSDGNQVIEIYLKLNDIENALNTAKEISDESDNYWQQDSFMKIADRFIKDGNLKQAKEVLDLAYDKANKIQFTHNVIQSTSPGIRKRKYLGEIYKRWINLKQFDKAYQTIFSINSKDSIATDFMVETLADFAFQQTNNLSKSKIYKLLDQAQRLVDKDSDYSQIKLKLKTAEVYLKLGDRQKALNIIANALTLIKDSCCCLEETLIEAGMLFEVYKLKANKNVKLALIEIIEEELS